MVVAIKSPNFVRLSFHQMSTKLIALAAEIVDTNPAGAQLIVDLTKAETGAEIVEALDNYDSAVLENENESAEDESEVTLTDADDVVTSV
jgi:hypothetical protein